MANGQVRTITQQLAQDPLGRPLSTPAFGQFFQEQLGREPTQSEVQQFATERGRLGQASRLTVDSNQLAQPAATQQATPSLQSLFGQAPQRTTLQDALSQVQGLLTPLGEAEKQSIREATRLEFAPRIARQKQIGESQQQLFKARAAQAAGGTFGAGERERKGLGSVQQEAQRNLSQLEGLQAAAAEARIAARESTNRKQQTDFIQLADQLQQRSEQAFQNFFKNIISLQKEDRAQQTFQQQQAAPLISASALDLVTVDSQGNIIEPTPEQINSTASTLGVDPLLVRQAVSEQVSSLQSADAAARKSQLDQLKLQAGISKTLAETEQLQALAPLKQQKLQAEINKLLKQTSNIGAGGTGTGGDMDRLGVLVELQNWSGKIQAGEASRDDVPSYLRGHIAENGFVTKPSEKDLKAITKQRTDFQANVTQPTGGVTVTEIRSQALDDIVKGASRDEVVKFYPELTQSQVDALFTAGERAKQATTIK